MFSEHFGIEIETQSPMSIDDFRRQYCPNGWHWVSPDGVQFSTCHDSSLMKRGLQGIEFISPILTEKDLPSVAQLVKFLRSIGCFTTNLCGLHVHLDRYVDGKQVNLVALKRRFDEEIKTAPEFILPYKNRDRGNTQQQAYCSLVFDRIDSGHRYQAIHTTNRTVEFRLFNGHLNFRYIRKCLEFCCGLIAEVR